MKLLALLALLVSSPLAFAGIFSPNEPCPFEMNPDGTAKPLPLNVFKLYLNDRMAALLPTSPDIQPGTANTLTFQGLIRQRISQDIEHGRPRLAGYSADLLRLGRYREVIEVLKPTLQDRTLDYVLLEHLALAHAALGDWDMAVKRNADAIFDGEPPTELAGTKTEQLKWMLRIDKAYTRKWLQAAKRHADPQTKVTDPDVLPLFDKEIPPDAVAIVQQMVLWAPLDENLLWLLGSIYLTSDRTKEAFDVLEQCRERKVTWPKFREQHSLAEAKYRALPKESPEEPMLTSPPDPTETPLPPRGLFDVVKPVQFAVVLGIFISLVMIIAALQIRKWLRRSRNGARK